MHVVEHDTSGSHQQSNYLARVFDLIIDFMYNECKSQFINNGSVNEMVFNLLRACLPNGKTTRFMPFVVGQKSFGFGFRHALVPTIQQETKAKGSHDLRVAAVCGVHENRRHRPAGLSQGKTVLRRRKPTVVVQAGGKAPDNPLEKGIVYAGYRPEWWNQSFMFWLKMASLVENNLIGRELADFKAFITEQDIIGETYLYSCYTNSDMYKELRDVLQADKVVDNHSLLTSVSEPRYFRSRERERELS
jgi:hypothetical protein